MDRGLLEEVTALASAPGGLSRTARQAVGYRELLRHVEEGADLERASRTRSSRADDWPVDNARGSCATLESSGSTTPTRRAYDCSAC